MADAAARQLQYEYKAVSNSIYYKIKYKNITSIKFTKMFRIVQ